MVEEIRFFDPTCFPDPLNLPADTSKKGQGSTDKRVVEVVYPVTSSRATFNTAAFEKELLLAGVM